MHNICSKGKASTDRQTDRHTHGQKDDEADWRTVGRRKKHKKI